MNNKQEVLSDVVIKFAGDSGDGMQLTGSQFTNNTAMLGIDLATFPDFPAEIFTMPGLAAWGGARQIHTVLVLRKICSVIPAIPIRPKTS